MGHRDASPLGSQCPWIDDSSAQFYHRDTVAPQGTWDADPLGLRHPWIDDRTWTCHSMIRTPECHETCKKPVQQDHNAREWMICYEEALNFSHHTGITSQPAGQKESKIWLTDTKHCYRLRCNEIQDRSAKPETSTGNAISLIPVDALPHSLEVEGFKSPRSKPTEWADWSDDYGPHLSLFCTSRAYTSTNTLDRNTETFSFTSNPTFHKPQEFVKFTKTLQNQEQVLDDTLHMLLSALKKELAYFTEVTDDAGLKRDEFTPEYAELLAWVMRLLTNTLNSY